MKAEPGDFLTGLLVLFAILIVTVAVVWVSPVHSVRPVPLYTEASQLGGVTLETPVLLNGFKVGQVDMIDPNVAPDGRVFFRIRMAMQWQIASSDATPYRTGMRVRLVPPPFEVFGTATIHLIPPATPGEPLQPGSVLPSVTETPFVARTDARLDTLTRQVARALVESRDLMASLKKTAEAASETARGAGTLTSNVDQRLADISASAQRSLARADSLVNELRALQPLARGTADSLNALMSDSRKALGKVTVLIGTAGPKLSGAIENLDATSAMLTNFVKSISERPTRLLTGVPPVPPPAKKDSTKPPPE